MSNSALDANSRGTMIARLDTDGKTILRLTADPTSGALSVDNSFVGAVTPKNYAGTDDNDRPTLFAVSENDRETPVALQCDSTGALLIKMI